MKQRLRLVECTQRGVMWAAIVSAVASLALAACQLQTGAMATGSTGEQGTVSDSVPVATRWMLDAAGEVQRNSMTSVYLIYCPKTQIKGSGFLLTSGIVVTNEHVVRGCAFHELIGMSSAREAIRFKNYVIDAGRDLALLRPAKALSGGLELGRDVSPLLGTPVTTWGFPLSYDGPAPLLSVGYVAGYSAVSNGPTVVKHIIVNGAFNPGNSGGPLFTANDNKVVGVVVSKWTLFSPDVTTVISGLRNSSAKLHGTFSFTRPDGNVRSASNEEAVAMVLEEFYRKVQVVIGEAIAVSELKAFIAAQRQL